MGSFQQINCFVYQTVGGAGDSSSVESKEEALEAERMRLEAVRLCVHMFSISITLHLPSFLSIFNKHCKGPCELLRLKHFRELQDTSKAH